jgi:crossover junction endodeoxyribonuclease RuvC
MRILGIDCGTEKTGFGFIDTDGRTHVLVEAGIVRTDPAHPLSERLRTIALEIRRTIASFAPDTVAVEEVFHAVNTKSALKLAHVRGAVLLVAAEAGLTVHEYSPLAIKMSVVGYGRAEKQQVEMMVRSLLHTQQPFESFDATDALAVAICHGTRALSPLTAAGVRH